MKIKTNLLKDARDEWLIQTVATLNEINPVVDRILEDETVAGVVMTNKEGNPIFTNINLMTANICGNAIAQLGNMATYSICEIFAHAIGKLEGSTSSIIVYHYCPSGPVQAILISNMDPFDELLVIRLKTKKTEVLAVPHKEFNIAVIQNTKASKSSKETGQMKPKV